MEEIQASDVIILLVGILFTVGIVIYYTMSIVEDYIYNSETKAQFWITILPFGRWFLNAVEVYKSL